MTCLLNAYVRAVLIASIAAAPAAAADSSAHSGMNPQRLALIRVRMQQYVDQHKAAGMVTIVARHGRIVSFEAVGFRDIEGGRPMQKDTLFQIMSLTKPVTCAGLMTLVDDGSISVIDAVEKFLPEYRDIRVDSCSGRIGYGCAIRAPSRAINIEDLMTHSSGLPADADIPTNEDQRLTLAGIASRGAKSTLLFEPGAAWSYSNLGYDVLGRIVEVVGQEPFDIFLKRRIFDPLGMKDTTFHPSAEQVSRLATVYRFTAPGLVRSPQQFTPDGARAPDPAGGLISSAEDMLRFNLMMRNGGILDGHRVLSPSAVHLMTVSHTGDLKAGWSPGVGHGYGYEVVRDGSGEFRYNSIGTFVKGGYYRTYEFVDPDKDLAGVLMIQLIDSGQDVADVINSFIQISSAAVE